MNAVEVIRLESDRFYRVADGAEPSLAVPSCPDWTVADLVWHLGRVHWFWRTIIKRRAAGPDVVEADVPSRPAEYSALVAWGRARAGELAATLEATADEVAVWTWALDEADHSVGFIRRHQIQEAAVHRWDLQYAVTPDACDPIDPEAAADAIDEFLAVSAPWSVNSESPLSGSVHIHCTDTDGEWLLYPDGRLERVHSKGDAAIRGAASDVLLALYERVPIERLDLLGDTALAREFVTRVNTD